MQKDTTHLLESFGIQSDTVDLGDATALENLEVVRHVPERRCVCKAIWQGKPVYAKLFFGEKAAQYALRDVSGVEALQQAKILTPAIIKQSKLSQHQAYAIVFEAVVGSENAEDVWRKANDFVRVELAHQLVQVVAQHHEAGLLQTDLYLKNFLIKYDAIYTIDGDGVRNLGKVSTKRAQTNLAKLLSKLDVLTLDGHLNALLETYAAARPWQPPLDVRTMQSKIEAVRWDATTAYADKKVFRQCTDVNVIKARSAFIALSEKALRDIFSRSDFSLDQYFVPNSIIKNGNTCTVATARMAALDVVIKRYNIKSLWHGISRAFRRSRASISWGNAHRLQLLGLPTAKPVALVETRRLGLRGKAYFITEYVDAIDMDQFFEQSTDKKIRAEAVKQVVQLFYQLHLLHISHGDMKANNIKVFADGQVSLIDLDSMQQHRAGKVAQKAHVRDIKRFMQNWKESPSLYNAFVKVFKVVYVDHAPLQAAEILE